MHWQTLSLHQSETKPASHPLWLWPNLFSLDAPLVAVLWLALFARCEHVALAPSVYLALGLVVWLIYVADRLLDAFEDTQDSAQSSRHRFYRQHGRVLTLSLPVLFGLSCWACIALDSRTFGYGVLLALIVSAYFVAVHLVPTSYRSWFPKEAVVAVIFGVGTFFPAWINVEKTTIAMVVSLCCFVLTCWLNLTFIEYAEWVDLRDARLKSPHAFTVAVGKHLSGIAIAVTIFVTLLTLSPPSRDQLPILWAIAMSAIALAALGFYRRRLAIDAIRVLADAALLTPAVVLLFLHL